MGKWERTGRLLCCFCFLTSGCSADTAFVSFQHLQRTDSPNDALACPTDVCAAPADFVTAAVDVSAENLARQVVDTLSKESRTELVAQDVAGGRFVFVQRSRLFRFPDTINVMVMPRGVGRAALALYSRSTYGHGDFGVNRARLEDWLAKLGIPYDVGKGRR